MASAVCHCCTACADQMMMWHKERLHACLLSHVKHASGTAVHRHYIHPTCLMSHVWWHLDMATWPRMSICMQAPLAPLPSLQAEQGLGHEANCDPHAILLSHTLLTPPLQQGDKDSSTTSSSSAASSISKSKEAAEDGAISTALQCECVKDLREGPCGLDFIAAFTCFHKSKEDVKGADCFRPNMAFAVRFATSLVPCKWGAS